MSFRSCPGQGILPHTDGPAYSPWAAVLSLGSAAVFEFWRDHAHAASGEASVLAVLLPPRSLLVFSEEIGMRSLLFDLICFCTAWVHEVSSSWIAE